VSREVEPERLLDSAFAFFLGYQKRFSLKSSSLNGSIGSYANLSRKIIPRLNNKVAVSRLRVRFLARNPLKTRTMRAKVDLREEIKRLI